MLRTVLFLAQSPFITGDLILVDGDPSKDVSILQDKDRMSAIMKDGSFYKAPMTARGAGAVAAE